MHNRNAAAAIGLLTFAGLILVACPIAAGRTPDRVALAMWGLLAPLAVTLVGVLRGAPWARWLALGAAVAVLPWALVLTVAPLGLPVGRHIVALAASLAVFGGLAGPSASGRRGDREERVDRGSRHTALVGWTIAANIASMLALYLFLVAFDYRSGWNLAAVWTFLVLLLFGVMALGRGKTAGILAIALAGLGLVVTGGAFLAPEANHVGEILLLGSIFLPGIVMGTALLCAFARPMWRVLRGG